MNEIFQIESNDVLIFCSLGLSSNLMHLIVSFVIVQGHRAQPSPANHGRLNACLNLVHNIIRVLGSPLFRKQVDCQNHVATSAIVLLGLLPPWR